MTPDRDGMRTEREFLEGIGEQLSPKQCLCTLDEYLDGHRHHCPDHRICSDCRCPSSAPEPMSHVACSLAEGHDEPHVDDTATITWERKEWE